MEKAKKPRSANFNPMEVELLCTLAEKYKRIIENKKTDAATWKDKDQAWVQLAAEFNTHGLGVYRNEKTLTLKYEGIKKNTRKKSAKIRTEVYRTGGGPSTAPPLTPAEEKVKKMILLTVDGLPSTFDSDVLSQEDATISVIEENFIVPSYTEDHQSPALQSERDDDNVDDDVKQFEPSHVIWDAQARKNLRTPKHKLLQVHEEPEPEQVEGIEVQMETAASPANPCILHSMQTYEGMNTPLSRAVVSCRVGPERSPLHGNQASVFASHTKQTGLGRARLSLASLFRVRATIQPARHETDVLCHKWMAIINHIV